VQRRAHAVVALALLALASTVARADLGLPPWSDPGDLPIPRWAKSVAPHKDDVAIFAMPNRAEPRRGSLSDTARPTLYGALRGPGCAGRWLQIGVAAWVCSDDVEMAADDAPPFARPSALPSRYKDDGLSFHYAFVGPEGAQGFRNLEHAGEDAPEADFDPGFAVAIVKEADANGQRWGETRHGAWIALHDLNTVRPLTLHGEAFREGDTMDVGWVLAEHAATYADAKAAKASGVRMRFDMVHRREEQKGPNGVMVRVSEDGKPPEWMRARDLVHPNISEPPAEVSGKDATARWIDVDLATQTLVAYEGTRPVYAALVAAGRGPQGSETATPIGVHRIWVKLLTSSMGNLGDEDAESHYSIEDVPYVQFFAKGVALHGAFWHHSFGSAHSHGCVNLAPVDARWLFDFTGPHLPDGWSAVLPAPAVDPGTVVRVRG
jgi:lipoprotein-anchoring transpeptidase ErfK/SrfK